MAEIPFSLLLFFSSIVAGIFGALSGLGGGSILTPLLTLGLGIDMRYAIGASLISVIATSCGAATTYTKEGFTNIRLGMFLELATTTGAMLGAISAIWFGKTFLSIIFGLLMFFSAWTSIRPLSKHKENQTPDALASSLNLHGTYPSESGTETYLVRNVPGGFSLMLLAGWLSGLLGIGSGALKVIAMDQAMQVPFKASTATSNFMIGVTAAASAGIYLNRGYIDPVLTVPVVLGIFIGSIVGARLLPKTKNEHLRKIFAALVIIIGIQMIYKGLASGAV